MRVYKCDRCGAYVDQSMKDFFVRNPTKGVYRLSKKIYLCGDCRRSFTEWLHALKSSETTAKLLRNEVRNDQKD